MITIIEFCHPLRRSGMPSNVLAVLYYLATFKGVPAVTIDTLRSNLTQARVKNARRANLADTLSKLAPFVHTIGEENGKFLWGITDSGKARVRDLLQLPITPPSIEQDVTELEVLIGRISDGDVKSYVEEAVKCLRVGALRAAVVFLWAGAVRRIQEDTLAFGARKLNSALLRHDPRARQVRKLDDFAHIRDKTVVLATEDLGLLDKNQRTTLEDCLNLRNKSGHPSRCTPGAKKVSAFIEDLVGIVF
jgi:hypothetical protein